LARSGGLSLSAHSMRRDEAHDQRADEPQSELGELGEEMAHCPTKLEIRVISVPRCKSKTWERPKAR
jgi:hypothetical protein